MLIVTAPKGISGAAGGRVTPARRASCKRCIELGFVKIGWGYVKQTRDRQSDCHRPTDF